MVSTLCCVLEPTSSNNFDASCPHTSRHTSDSNCLFFSFDKHMALPVVVDALTVYPSILQSTSASPEFKGDIQHSPTFLNIYIFTL